MSTNIFSKTPAKCKIFIIYCFEIITPKSVPYLAHPVVVTVATKQQTATEHTSRSASNSIKISIDCTDAYGVHSAAHHQQLETKLLIIRLVRNTSKFNPQPV